MLLFNDPEKWAEENNIEFPNWHSGGLGSVLEYAYPELRDQRSFYDAVWKDLYNKGLLNTEEMHVLMTGHGMMASRTTDLARKFIRFIKDPLL